MNETAKRKERFDTHHSPTMNMLVRISPPLWIKGNNHLFFDQVLIALLLQDMTDYTGIDPLSIVAGQIYHDYIDEKYNGLFLPGHIAYLRRLLELHDSIYYDELNSDASNWMQAKEIARHRVYQIIDQDYAPLEGFS